MNDSRIVTASQQQSNQYPPLNYIFSSKIRSLNLIYLKWEEDFWEFGDTTVL